MCGGKYRARRYQQQPYISGHSLISGLSPIVQNRRAAAIDNVLHAYNTPQIASHMVQQPQARGSAPAYTAAAGQVQVPEMKSDMKPDISNADPPAYEKVAGEVAPEVVTRTVSNNSPMNNVLPVNKQSPILPSQYQASPEINRLIGLFSTALAEYHSGKGRRRHVRRAQKELRDVLYETEIARRTAMYGRLRCGEKCEIWREVKAINFGY